MSIKYPRSRGIVVTGASGGLGAALVMEYAAPQIHFLILGRDSARLDALAERAREVGASVDCLPGLGTDHATIAQAIDRFDKTSPIDLLICAAGTKTNNLNGTEDFVRFENVIDINLMFPAFVTQCVLTGMRDRQRGQIVFISSLAAMAPHPDLLSYSASKAGLSGYAVALRRRLMPFKIGVTLVSPGFIDTPMTTNHIGPTPMCVSTKWAARRIRIGTNRKSAYVSFPLPLIILTWFWNLLPAGPADWINRLFRAEIVDKDRD